MGVESLVSGGRAKERIGLVADPVIGIGRIIIRGGGAVIIEDGRSVLRGGARLDGRIRSSEIPVVLAQERKVYQYTNLFLQRVSRSFYNERRFNDVEILRMFGATYYEDIGRAANGESLQGRTSRARGIERVQKIRAMAQAVIGPTLVDEMLKSEIFEQAASTAIFYHNQSRGNVPQDQIAHIANLLDNVSGNLHGHDFMHACFALQTDGVPRPAFLNDPEQVNNKSLLVEEQKALLATFADEPRPIAASILDRRFARERAKHFEDLAEVEANKYRNNLPWSRLRYDNFRARAAAYREASKTSNMNYQQFRNLYHQIWRNTFILVQLDAVESTRGFTERFTSQDNVLRGFNTIADEMAANPDPSFEKMLRETYSAGARPMGVYSIWRTSVSSLEAAARSQGVIR